jgi:hypothetical protein
MARRTKLRHLFEGSKEKTLREGQCPDDCHKTMNMLGNPDYWMKSLMEQIDILCRHRADLSTVDHRFVKVHADIIVDICTELIRSEDHENGH